MEEWSLKKKGREKRGRKGKEEREGNEKYAAPSTIPVDKFQKCVLACDNCAHMQNEEMSGLARAVYSSMFVRSAAFAAFFFFFSIMPTHASASSLIWGNQEGGVPAQIEIIDGGTYSVPLDTPAPGYVVVPSDPFSFGILYRIVDSGGSPVRENVFIFSSHSGGPEFAWPASGTYELDIATFGPPMLMWNDKLMHWLARALFADVAYAQFGAPVVETLHFTIQDAGLACAQNCFSNVLFLPGIEASRLYYRGILGTEHQVWEPNFHTDIPYLAMNADGTSKYQLYTRDIVDTLQAHNLLESTIASMFGNNLDTYSGFEHFMDGLVTDGTVKEWRAYPYDWRHDVRDIVNNGTPTEMPDGSVQQVYLRDVLEEMASNSPSKKVTIVAHSNGGLLAKALALSLGADAPKYIDRIIMVGTPQWGTPAAIGALLHADNFSDTPNLIVNSTEMRTVMSSMGGAYGLLPSPAYFTPISDPVVTFNTGGLLSGKYATSLDAALTSFPVFVNFLKDSFGLDAQVGSVTNLRVPLALSSTLVDKATATHDALDAWTPVGISVTAIAGWGQDTVKTLAYTTGSKVVCTAGPAFTTFSSCADTPELLHTPATTQDGDNTVVSPSAVGNTSDSLYFNAARFRDDGNGNFTHQNLTSGIPIQKVVTDLLMNKNPTVEQYIVIDKPTDGANPIKLRVSSHSPVNIVATDAAGNQSGVLPIPGTDFSGVKRDIPGSSVQVFDDEEYINVPQSGTYQIVASGYAPGSATLNVDTVGSNGVVTATTTFANTPTTVSSTATFSVVSGAPTAPIVDITGDGKNTFTAVSSSATTDPLVYVRYMRTVIKALALSKDVRHELDEKLGEIERQLVTAQKEPDDRGKNNKDKEKKDKEREKVKKDNNDKILRQLTTLWNYVERKSQKGISTTTAEIILGMVNQLKALI